jgi:hypothetical protein
MSASGVIMFKSFAALHMFHLYEAENNGKKPRANPRDKNNAEIRQSRLIPFLSCFTLSTALSILYRSVLHYPALSRTVLLYAALPHAVSCTSILSKVCCTIHTRIALLCHLNRLTNRFNEQKQRLCVLLDLSQDEARTDLLKIAT